MKNLNLLAIYVCFFLLPSENQVSWPKVPQVRKGFSLLHNSSSFISVGGARGVFFLVIFSWSSPSQFLGVLGQE